MLVANVIGGIAAILVYELLVVVPFLPFAFVTLFAVMVWFSHRFITGDYAHRFGDYGIFDFDRWNIDCPFSDDAQTKMIFRLWQLGAAFIYLSLAFAVVDRFCSRECKRNLIARHLLIGECVVTRYCPTASLPEQGG